METVETRFGYFYGKTYHIIRADGRTMCGMDMRNGFVKTWEQLRPKRFRPRRCRKCWR